MGRYEQRRRGAQAAIWPLRPGLLRAISNKFRHFVRKFGIDREEPFS